MSFKWNPISGQLDLIGPPQTNEAEKLVSTFIAGEPLSAVRLVYLNNSNTVFYADANTLIENAQVIGVTLSAALLGALVDVQLFGKLDDGSFLFSANSLLFLGTNGAITQTVPTTGFQTTIGYGLGTGSIFIDIEKPIALGA